MTPELLIDNSAWSRFWHPDLPEARVLELAADLEAKRFAASLPLLLEAGYSARNADDHVEIREELFALPFVAVDGDVEDRAFDAQAQLARAGHHRISPSDVLLAAIADCAALGVLHYDKDFDLIHEKTDLDFHSHWLMPRGSL